MRALTWPEIETVRAPALGMRTQNSSWSAEQDR